MARSQHIPAQAPMGWASRSALTPTRIRLRDLLPPIAAILAITLALIASGAVQPAVTHSISAALAMAATFAIVIAGPGSVTRGMLIGAAIVALAAFTGVAGPLYRSAPILAAIFAAGCAWTVGYLAAPRRGVLDAVWTTLVWASIAYCAWLFVAYITTVRGGDVSGLSGLFQTPANGAVVFGLLAVIAMGRLLHILKQIDAENPARARMIERLLRDGVGALLLLFLALACLILTGSQAGMMFTGAVMFGYAWWDTLGITTRIHHGFRMRLIVVLAPVLAIGLAGWGVMHGWMADDTITPGLGAPEIPARLQRLEAYSAAWLESPMTGHGLGSVASEGARFQTLHNAKAMLAPGGAQNLPLTWLVETGVIGLALLLSVLGAIHVRIVSALSSRRTPRSFPRLALAATTLLLLHGVTGSSLDIPAVGWLYALLLGCACGLATRQTEKSP